MMRGEGLMSKVIVGLAGNPNVGKTTVFNQLTGMRQHVGNWPGKTVERAEGHFTHGDYEYDIIDDGEDCRLTNGRMLRVS